VNTTEQTAKPAPMPGEGLFAPCSSVLRVEGVGAPASVTRRVFVLALLALATVLPVLVFSAPARAAYTHRYLSQVTGFGGFVRGMTVDASSDLYVAVEGVGVERFDSADAPLPFTASAGYIEGNRLTGTPTGAAGAVVPFGDPEGLAVDDATGEVYVADDRLRVIDVFSSDGEYLRQLTGTPPSAPRSGAFFGRMMGLAVDQATQDLYVADGEQALGESGEYEPVGDVDVFNASGEYLSQFGNGSIGLNGGLQSVAVDDLTEEVYVPTIRQVPNPGHVQYFNYPRVSLFGGFGSLAPTEWTGPSEDPFGYDLSVGLDPTTDHVYVADDQKDVVDEFGSSPSEEYEGQLTGTPAGPFLYPDLVAVAPVTGDVYVYDFKAGAVDVFGPDLALPDAISGAASDLTATSATLNGEVDPLEAETHEPAECAFLWGTSEALGKEAQCESSEVKGTGDMAVKAPLGGLKRDTTYYYQVRAKNTNGAEEGAISHFTTLGANVENWSVAEVASTSATFEATVSPNTSPTSVSFEYGRCASLSACASTAYESSTVAEAIGSGASGVSVEQQAEGLSPGTVYHYRVVAASEIGGESEGSSGLEATFTTQTAATSGLPDGREWEMVSPADMHGAHVLPIIGEDVLQAAADGDAFTYLTNAPTEGQPPGYSNLMQVFAARGSDGGWQSRDIGLPIGEATGLSLGEGQAYWFFSEDLSHAEVQPIGQYAPSSSPAALAPIEASEQTGFIRTNFEGGQVTSPCLESCYRPLVTGAPGFANVPEGTIFGFGSEGPGVSVCRIAFCGPNMEGATPDLSHVVLSSRGGLTSAGVGNALYEWSGGQLAPVSVLPANEGGALKGGGVSLGATGETANMRHAISRDGSRVVWTDADNSHMYVRENAMQPQSPTAPGGECTVPADACTIRLDEGVPPGGRETFQTASEDGRLVFFTNEGKEGNALLYEYNVETGQRALVAEHVESKLPVLGASADGSFVYFVSSAVLQSGGLPVAGALAGEPNLYVRHGGTVALVAVLSSEDTADLPSKLWEQTTQVSGNGEWLAFMSQRELTGYDNRDAVSGRPDQEVYLYHAALSGTLGAGRLICASCDPSGARPHGVEYRNFGAGGGIFSLAGGYSIWPESTWIAANVPTWTAHGKSEALYQSRYLLEDGRLFFNSSDALVPRDVNGTEDLYEWEPPGVGGCSVGGAGFSERSGGCIGLISAGASSEESAFLDASQSGSDVFFVADAGLAGRTSETTLTVYDAHECTAAAPCAPGSVPQPPACTTADSCRAATSPQPVVFGAPASATFSGPSNLGSAAKPTVTPRTLTRAQKLAAALKECRSADRRRGRRAACEASARRRYGAKAARRRADTNTDRRRTQ
jgi:DNA-binding beta-propeller fold protein YncE